MNTESENQEGYAQHQLIIEDAIQRGIQIDDLTGIYGTIAHKLSQNNQSIILVQGIVQEWVDSSAEKICDHKDKTKELFKSLGIPTPESLVFEKPDELFRKIDQSLSYVCKPSVGSNGIGVQMDIGSMNDVKSYYQTYGKLCDKHLIEEFVNGYDLRIQVINSEIIAACLRLPAHVMGNGKSTLKQLISLRRKEIKVQNPSNDLIVDGQTMELLENQNILLQDIIPMNNKIHLKKVANMAQGGHAIDVTNEIDSIYHYWVRSISKELNIGYFALDLITEDHINFKIRNTFALEINSRAEWMHHTFSERKTHDLAGIILDVVF